MNKIIEKQPVMRDAKSGNPHLALEKQNFHRCFETPLFAQWAYKTPNHLHKDIEHPKYFSVIRQRLEVGDHIMAIDAAMEYRTYVIEDIDIKANLVVLSILQQHELKPVVSEAEGLVWRWRGPKGGGHCILNADGEIIANGFNSKQSALQEIERQRIVAGLDETPEAAPAAA